MPADGWVELTPGAWIEEDAIADVLLRMGAGYGGRRLADDQAQAVGEAWSEAT